MPKLRLEDLLRPTTDPEQANLLDNFYARFDVGSGILHRSILNVEPLFFQGGIPGSEFLVYNVSKLYICYRLYVDADLAPTTLGVLGLWDENNNQYAQAQNLAPYWNNTTATLAFTRADIEFKNMFFSRIDVVIYVRMIFNGYRITLN